MGAYDVMPIKLRIFYTTITVLSCVILTNEFIRAFAGIFIGVLLTMDLYHYRDCEVEKRRKELERVNQALNSINNH